MNSTKVRAVGVAFAIWIPLWVFGTWAGSRLVYAGHDIGYAVSLFCGVIGGAVATNVGIMLWPRR